MKREKTLTIYCDESGDLGGYCKESPVYCLSLVLLSSEDDATPHLRELHREYHSKNGGEPPFHAGPIIRGEESYRGLNKCERLELFDIAFDLALTSPIKAINIGAKKENRDAIDSPTKELTRVIFDHIEYFRSFCKIRFYYDNGQEGKSFCHGRFCYPDIYVTDDGNVELIAGYHNVYIGNPEEDVFAMATLAFKNDFVTVQTSQDAINAFLDGYGYATEGFLEKLWEYLVSLARKEDNMHEARYLMECAVGVLQVIKATE